MTPMKYNLHRARRHRPLAQQSDTSFQTDVGIGASASKRIRTPAQAKGKYNPKRRFTHLEWVKAVRAWCRAKGQIFLKTSLGKGRILRRHFIRGEEQMGEPTSSRCMSSHTGTRVTQRALKRYYALQLVQNSWPVRLATGLDTFFSRLWQGLCLRCGNHVGEWWFIGCYSQALKEEFRLLQHAHFIAANLRSLDFTHSDSWVALAEHRARIIGLIADTVKLRMRKTAIWIELFGWMIPRALWRARNLGAVVTDLTRLAFIVGGDYRAAEERFSVPSRSQVVRNLASVVVQRPTAHVVRELGNRMGIPDLEKLISSPSEFILGQDQVKGYFRALFEKPIRAAPVRYRATGDLGKLVKFLNLFYQGCVPDCVQELLTVTYYLYKDVPYKAPLATNCLARETWKRVFSLRDGSWTCQNVREISFKGENSAIELMSSSEVVSWRERVLAPSFHRLEAGETRIKGVRRHNTSKIVFHTPCAVSSTWEEEPFWEGGYPTTHTEIRYGPANRDWNSVLEVPELAFAVEGTETSAEFSLPR